MKKSYQRYTREFKLEAVRMAKESNETMRQVARDLNIRPNQLYKWQKELSAKSPSAFPGKDYIVLYQRHMKYQICAKKEKKKQQKNQVA